MRFFLTFFTLIFSIASFAQTELKVYTYGLLAGKDGMAQRWATDFEQQCDCKISILSVDSSSAQLIQRVKLDAKAADIIIGVEADYMELARDMVQPHRLGTQDYVFDWQDPDFLAFDYGWLSLMGRRGEDMPKSFADLTANPDIKVIMEQPQTSGFGYWFHSVYGDETKQQWEKLQANILTLTPSWSDAYSLFLRGEGDLVLTYTTSPAYHKEFEQSNAYMSAIFDEGHYLQIETMAMLKTSQNQELAREFLQYILSSDAQTHTPLYNFMLPVIDVPLPDSFQNLETPKSSLPKVPVDAKILDIYR